ncbi:unnamed protein product [Blepharisma stoltei]|uniref:Uncharacterized protein n=1 Tax=Blepharisma stoltei TaxID=1481888 RepID=A0AAU9JRD8_9CILI|nr:unnamed protein product [Blepharisma stoltei]
MKKCLLNYQLSLSEIAKNNANEHSEVSIASSGLNSTDQEYAAASHQSASLYLLELDKHKVNLFIYDTKSEREEVQRLKTPKPLDRFSCAALLPNSELFCFGMYPLFGTTLIFDSNYKAYELPSGTPCFYSSVIYFNTSVYCFGGSNDQGLLNLSCRFDLNRNRWIKLAPMPKPDWYCNSITFNRNILISGVWNKNIWLYSVDIDSFSVIPYEFAWLKRKILINAEERLYLIECEGEAIYESRVGDEYVWEIIGNSIISLCPSYVFWAYNERGIYIGCIEYKSRKKTRHYYKFNLDRKELIELENNKPACNLF